MLAVTLKDGGTAEIWPDGVSVMGERHPLTQVSVASLASDVRGNSPLPAVALRLAGGNTLAFTPADASDAWRFLEVLFLQRPDLRHPLPPQGPARQQYAPPPPPPPPYGGYAYGPYGYGAPGYPPQARANNNDTILAGISHLSVFFGPIIVPLIIWLISRESSPYAAQQGKQAFLFHAAVSIVQILLVVVLFLGFFGSFAAFNPDAPSGTVFLPIVLSLLIYGLMFLVGIGSIVYSIIGAVAAFQGKPFHYPFLGRA